MQLLPSSLLTTSVLWFSAVGTRANTCSYLDNVSPLDFELPASSVLDGSTLPIHFIGVAPSVIRKTLPPGGTPKVTVTKYSIAPTVTYDESSGTLHVSADGCDTVYGAASEASSSRQQVTMGLTVAAAVLTKQPLLAAAAAMMWPSQVVGQECTHAVELVVEAPLTYMGAVETCLAEVSETGHCPDPFPTFPTCADLQPECEVAVVGAGAGALYAALRYVTPMLRLWTAC